MGFCMEASGPTSFVRRRMKNALGKWSAQYQVLEGAGAAPASALEFDSEAAPHPEAAVSDGSEDGGDFVAGNVTSGPEPVEDRHETAAEPKAEEARQEH